MASSTQSLLNLDPEHISCIGGRTVVTCKGCAGNAPRGAICLSCNGRGFNIFVCAHCNPRSCSCRSQSNGEPHSCVCRNTRILGTVIPRLSKSQLVWLASFTYRSKRRSFVRKIWGWS